MRRVFILCAFCLILAAQDTTAGLEGQITDPSGGMISGAMVQAVNAKTGFTRSQITTNSGAFHLTLSTGDYDLHVSAAGFAQFTRTGIERNVNQTARTDIQLRIAKEKDHRFLFEPAGPHRRSQMRVHIRRING